MARIRPAKGQNDPGPAGARRPDPQRARPVQAKSRTDKVGTVTKGLQQGKATKFLADTVAEMRKVSWPNRTQLTQATAVVLLFVVVVTAYLAGLDAVFSRLVDSIF